MSVQKREDTSDGRFEMTGRHEEGQWGGQKRPGSQIDYLVETRKVTGQLDLPWGYIMGAETDNVGSPRLIKVCEKGEFESKNARTGRGRKRGKRGDDQTGEKKKRGGE